MKKFTIITAIILTANLLFAQYNKIDTSFYSEALQETKMVDVYFPPGYDENPDWHYPVIYYLHGWTGDQNSMGTMLTWVQSLINNGIIDPVIMVGADNSPEPFEGSGYVNSIIWGNYEDYMINDLITWVETSFRAMPDRDYRGMIGNSMGGYGAFRYGILHKDKFRVFAAHGTSGLSFDTMLETWQPQIILENQPGPPYFYDYATDGVFTQAFFLFSGVASPNLNTPQTYINPPIVEYLLDENAMIIDTVYAKWQAFDLSQLIHQLSIDDSVGIFFACGTNDGFLLHPSHLVFKDTLDLLGLPYEFYSHDGNHSMPGAFKQRAFTFLDSLLMPPGIYTGTHQPTHQKIRFSLQNYPNPFDQRTTIEMTFREKSEITVSIYNQLGVKAATIFEGSKEKGIHKLIWNPENFSSGIYFIKLQTDKGSTTQKIIKR